MDINTLLQDAIENIDVNDSKVGDIVMLPEVCSGCM